MKENLIKIEKTNIEILKKFLINIGNSSKTFRFFEKKDLNYITNFKICYIILLDDEPIAYGHLDDDGENVWLGICVTENKIGFGFGTKMMKCLIDFALINKIIKIKLSVDSFNYSAIKLYEKFGFKLEEKIGETNFMILKLGECYV